MMFPVHALSRAVNRNAVSGPNNRPEVSKYNQRLNRVLVNRTHGMVELSILRAIHFLPSDRLVQAVAVRHFQNQRT